MKKRKIYFEELRDESLNIREEQQNSMPMLSVDKVQHAMAHLPEGYRAVFSLYAFEGYDHKEIAQIMDITESTSKSQYSRAKKKLRDLLESKDLEMNYLS